MDAHGDADRAVLRIKASHVKTAFIVIAGALAGVVLFLLVKPYAPDITALAGPDSVADSILWSEAPRFDVGVVGRPSIGSANASVTIVEFTDYGCPYCRRHALEVLPALLDSSGHGINYVVRHFPIPALTPNAMNAALAAECAFRQDRFWEYKRALQEELEGFQEERLRANATAVGLDEAEFDRCIEEDSVRRIVERDILDAWEYGVTGTPTFFINGKRFRGARSLEALLEYVRLASHEANFN